MKRTFSLVVMLLTCMAMMAQSEFLNKKFYLYNEATGLFICSNNRFGLKASLTEDANLFSLEEPNKGPAYALYNLDIDNTHYIDQPDIYHNFQRLAIYPYLSLGNTAIAFYSAWITDSNNFDDMVDGVWQINRVDDEFVTITLIGCKLYDEEYIHPCRYITASTEKEHVRGYQLMLSETMTDRALFRVFYEDDILPFMQEKAKTEKISYNFLIQNPDLVGELRTDKWMLDGEPIINWRFESEQGYNSYAVFEGKSFTLEQTIENLPAGKYEMSAQAFYLDRNTSHPAMNMPKAYVNDHVQEIKHASPESKSEYGHYVIEEIFNNGLEYITPIRFTTNGEPIKIGFSLENEENLYVYFDNIRITNVTDDDGGIDPDPEGWEVTDEDGDKDEDGDEEKVVDPNEEGTPMEPIKPDLNKYTHKMMVLGAPWGVEDLCMAILRDNEGRVVQKMTMRIDGDNLSAHMTDSVRTYAYEDNKMIEYLAVPHYDENDVLHMEPMNRTTTSYYKLTNGHREVVEQAWLEDGEYVVNGREEYVFDSKGRKVNYKKYFRGELESDINYTYDADGGCLGKGLHDGYDKYVSYRKVDANGNLRGNTEWGTYYEYFYDNQNHYQGYKYYFDYNFDDNTYGSVNDNNYFEVLESYADGSIKKMKRKGDGEVRTYSREGNVETQINTPAEGAQVTITRTFDDQGRIVAKTSTNRTFKSNYIYSDLKADQVLGGVNTFDEDLHTNYQEQVNWTYSNPLLATSYEYTFWGLDKKAFSTYNIVPLSVLPAQTTEEGVAISVGNDGDQVVLSNEGEIYLLDKGGKKRYSVSIGGITVSSEGGKIVVTGWTPISPDASANAMRMAPKTIDLTTNEYDIYIPEDVITINGKPLNEVYLPITLEEESTGIVEVKTGNRNTYSDGHLYNLQGIQVTNPANGQIVIMNGKKVVVK